MSICTKGITFKGITQVISQKIILDKYLSIEYLPCCIKNPLREDNHPSLYIYENAQGNIRFKDFATGQHFNLRDFLCELFETNYVGLLKKLKNDFMVGDFQLELYNKPKQETKKKEKEFVEINIKTRSFNEADKNYWGSYGISINLLKRANVFPITQFVVKNKVAEVLYEADELAYAYLEKRDRIYVKIYQPFNKEVKWKSNMNSNIISLWNLLPEKGDKVCICSSVKDALCLYQNTGIYAICPQGEGYNLPSKTIAELRKRFRKKYICLDNDKAGLLNSTRLAKETGFTNLILPNICSGKDISDFYNKNVNIKELFETMTK